jgi:hypothetical protein
MMATPDSTNYLTNLFIFLKTLSDSIVDFWFFFKIKLN